MRWPEPSPSLCCPARWAHMQGNLLVTISGAPSTCFWHYSRALVVCLRLTSCMTCVLRVTRPMLAFVMQRRTCCTSTQASSPHPAHLQGSALEKVADYTLAAAIPVHMHITTNAVVTDYVPSAFRGMPASCVSTTTYVPGLIEFALRGRGVAFSSSYGSLACYSAARCVAHIQQQLYIASAVDDVALAAYVLISRLFL